MEASDLSWTFAFLQALQHAARAADQRLTESSTLLSDWSAKFFIVTPVKGPKFERRIEKHFDILFEDLINAADLS